MGDLRTQGCLGKPIVLDAKAPFSNFDFVEDHFGMAGGPLKRIFSQMRTAGFSSFVMEEIPSVGFSQEDDLELEKAGVVLRNNNLRRLSFFRKNIRDIAAINQQTNQDYLGYVILKLIPAGRWIVFESVTVVSRHDNNFYHALKKYSVRCVGKIFEIRGNIYCQQNDKTNVCAHVALRTALSMLPEHDDYSYSGMNNILETIKQAHVYGLTIQQMSNLLNELKVKHAVYADNIKKRDVPFQKCLYASIESGYPALLGFDCAGGKHIIPVIGHTFNEDTWVPNAEENYFTVGKNTRYVPSETWVSSYICHDDNFGSHFCLPRQYLTHQNNVFVIAMYPQKAQYDAIAAEAIAADYLFSIAPGLPVNGNRWLKRLQDSVMKGYGWFVLRTIYMTGHEYVNSLMNAEGWGGEKINSKVLDGLRSTLKAEYWVVEVSLPELFPANRRKLGEILLNAEISLSNGINPSMFAFSRLPGLFYFLSRGGDGKDFVEDRVCEIKTHTKVFSIHPQDVVPRSYVEQLLARLCMRLKCA